MQPSRDLQHPSYEQRFTAMNHEFGLQTVGDAALCGGVPSPFMQKSQYRVSMVYPVPEVTSNHAIGANTAKWGLGHSFHGPGDEHVYLLWEWEDCCLPVI